MAESNNGLRAWLHAANPFATAETQAEALRAGRIGAITMALMAVQAAAGILLLRAMFSGPGLDAMRHTFQARYAAAGLDADSSKAMAESVTTMIPTVMVDVFGGIAVILAACAIFTWFKPNRPIPLIVLLITVAGLALRLLQLVLQHGTPAIPQPAWMTAYSLVTYLVVIPLLIAGFRGAGRLRELKLEAELAAADI